MSILQNSFIQKYSLRMKGLIYRIREHLNGYKKEKKRFREKLGYELNLKKPKTFNQKIVWKKIYDRNPLLRIIVDKHKVREYVTLMIGEKKAKMILIPLLFSTKNPKKIPFDTLPKECIIKTTHASNTNIIVNTKNPIDQRNAIKQLISWCNKPFGLLHHEWAYHKISPRIIIEKLLYDDNGELPIDYKFLVFHGKCHYIQVYDQRKTEITCSFFDNDWNQLSISWKNSKGPYITKPDNLNLMIEIAERLASPFDFLRVDLYSINGKIYFGELTNYPASGHLQIKPLKADLQIGSKWKIENNYWKDKKYKYKQLIQYFKKIKKNKKVNDLTLIKIQKKHSSQKS